MSIIGDYINVNKQEMVDNLIALLSIPSIANENDSDMPCGVEVDKAFDFFVALARSMGFEASKKGKCAEVIFGGGKKAKKVYIATHLDVVPAGDGWKTDPYSGAVRNGRIYGRGALDDKGPALAALYALKAVKNMGGVPKAEIRLILGGCEETSMSDLKEYVEKNGLPDYGLTPDSSFPIINAEVGVAFGKLHFINSSESKRVILRNLSAGRAYNCVPDICTAELETSEEYLREAKKLLRELSDGRDDFEFNVSGTSFSLTTTGVSAHGSVPGQGKNAAFAMITVLKALFDAAGEKNDFIDTGMKYFVGDIKGERLGIACSDEPTGDLSLNVGMCEYSERTKKGFYSFDIRVPVTLSADAVAERLADFAREAGAELEVKKVEQSTYLSPDSDFLKKLAECYTEITGKKAEFLTCRGVTYAKAFGGRGVAFGPIDENDPSQGGNIHGIDEFISTEAYLNLSRIYAAAIQKLFC